MGGLLGKIVHYVVDRVPALLLFVALGGLAYWGHANDWRAPTWNALWGGADKAEKVAKAGSQTEAKSGDSTAPKDWCAQHGVPDSQCTICHPEIAVKGTLPPDDRQVKTIAEPAAAKAFPASACQTHLKRVEFASSEAVAKAGLEYASVAERPLAQFVTANGATDYDQTRIAHLISRAPGAVWRVEKQLGHSVKKGDVLAIVEAAEVGKAKAELLHAVALVHLRIATLDSLRQVATAVSERQVREADASLREARIRLFNAQQALINLGLTLPDEDFLKLPDDQLAKRLRLLGLPATITQGLPGDSTTANLLPLYAPFDGVVVGRDMVIGEVVGPAQTQFIVADVRQMWVHLDVRVEDAARLVLGQDVTFQPDGAADEVARGKLSWISTEIDEKTRTLKVRAEVDNSAGRLRAHMFGAGRILVRATPKAIAVPTEAIQWEGCCQIVFIRVGPTAFQTRKVRLGVHQGSYTEIVVGVLPGEIVVTTGSHLLKSEILKDRIVGEE